MSEPTEEELAREFDGHRGPLVAVAYRLTGTIADAEDAVQEAWLRFWALPEARRAEIRDRRAWLTTVVGRIGLDHLRSAPARRERYFGEWLPEPIVTPLPGLGAPKADDPLEAIVRDEGVRMAAMIVLDRLSPEQRVAFVLHDAFSVPFAEIAETLGCSADAARQHASRARRAVADAEPPPRSALDEQRELLQRFMTAVMEGDLATLTEVLHPDAVLIGDANGKARTTVRVMAGADKLIRFFLGLLRMYGTGVFGASRPVLVNGDLGLFVPAAPGTDEHRALDTHVQAMTIRDGRIATLYDFANPDKLVQASRTFAEITAAG